MSPQQQIPTRSELRKLPLDTVCEGLSQAGEARLHRGLSGAADLMLSPATDSLEGPQMPLLPSHSPVAQLLCAGPCCCRSCVDGCQHTGSPGGCPADWAALCAHPEVMMWPCCSCCTVWECGRWVPREQGGFRQQWPRTRHAQGAQVLCMSAQVLKPWHGCFEALYFPEFNE